MTSACAGSGTAVAATVNGQEVTVGEIEALIDPSEATVSKEEFAQFLSLGIQMRIIASGILEEWGIQFTDEEIAAEADRIVAEATSVSGESREEFLSARGVTEQLLINVAHQSLLEQALRQELAPTVSQPSQEEVDAQIDASRLALTQVCVSHILVETEAEALEVLGRLEAGEAFGDLAAELSIDPGTAESEGSLGCASPGDYVAQFRDASLEAPIGEVHDVAVETDFGFHVMLVEDRTEPEPELLPSEEDIIESLINQAVGTQINMWFFEVVTEAEVHVEERFGTWDPAFAEVMPPSEE